MVAVVVVAVPVDSDVVAVLVDSDVVAVGWFLIEVAVAADVY